MPAVEREYRNFNRKCQEKRGKYPSLFTRSQGRGRERFKIERVRHWCPEPQVNQGYQHKKASGEGIDKELEGDPDAVVSTPEGTDEPGGDERHLPEYIKNQAVECGKDPDQSGLHQQDQGVKGAGVAEGTDEGGTNDHGQEEGGEHHHEQADTVQPEFQADAEGIEPGGIEQEVAVAVVTEDPPGHDGCPEFDKRAGQGEFPDGLLILHRRKDEGKGKGDEYENNGHHSQTRMLKKRIAMIPRIMINI